MPNFYDVVKRGYDLTDEEWNEHLLDFHNRAVGATARVLFNLVSHNGLSSYDKLALQARGAQSVLELGCGSGELLPLIRKNMSSQGTLYALDMSASELELARLKDPETTFFYKQAQEIPLPDHSVDVVLCHFFLMCVLPLDPVIHEIRRILKVGGRFSAILPAFDEASGHFAEVREILFKYLRSEHPQFASFRVGDSRANSVAGLHDLFDEMGHVEIESLSVSGQFSEEDLWYLVGKSYIPFALNAEDRAVLGGQIKEYARTRLRDQILQLPLRQVTVQIRERI